jgi:Ca2+-binding EF-hand superfamily protein
MTKSLVIASCLTVAAMLSSAADAANTSGNKMEEMFKKADKDNDGTLTRDEAKALPRVAKNFDQIDTDKDGTVSLDEIYASAKKIAKEIEARDKAKFDVADKDHDGTLDRDEAKAFPRISQNFDKIDANKDGKVSQDEIKSYAKAQRSAKGGTQ